MTKQIKFRYWDKQTKSYKTDAVLMNGYLYSFVNKDNNTYLKKIDSCDIEQYIGNSDKHECPIYENDLVLVDGQNCIYVIRWEDSSSMFKLYPYKAEGYAQNFEFTLADCDTTVIGNINEGIKAEFMTTVNERKLLNV